MTEYFTPPSGGMTVHLIFDAAADAAPQTFRDGVEQAARLLSQAIANPITINIKVDYSGTGHNADAKNDGLGAFESYEPMSATEVLSILGATAGSFAPGVGTVIGGTLGRPCRESPAQFGASLQFQPEYSPGLDSELLVEPRGFVADGHKLYSGMAFCLGYERAAEAFRAVSPE